MPEYDIEALKRRFNGLDETLQGLEPKDTRRRPFEVNQADLDTWRKCPSCGSENITNEDHEWWDTYTIAYDTSCYDCDHHWWEVYKAVGREEVKP